MAHVAALKARAVQAVEERHRELIGLCCEIIRRPSPNPPGDTTAVADYIAAYLRAHGLPVDLRARVPDEPNVVSSVVGSRERPHLVLCGHMDTFGEAEPELWSYPPYCGEVRDGKILGRGASDMKGGLTGLLFAYVVLHDLGIELPGRLTYLAVSDEEDGGENGLGWLMGTWPELVGDAGIIGEPNSIDQVSIANKGIAVFRLVAEGEAYHGGIGAGENVVSRIARAILALRALVDEEHPPPPALAEVLRIQRKLDRTGADERRGGGWLVTRPSVNIGVVRGGVRHNIVPRLAEVEVDVRTPQGMTPEACFARVRELLDEAGCHDVKLVPHHYLRFPPHFTPPDAPLPQIFRRNVESVTGREPIFIMTFPSGDIRFFRLRGIPGVVYGTNPYNVGGLDEFITVDDLVTIAKVYAASIVDYFHEVS